MAAGFDIIALGHNLATTLAAALLARRGRRVLLAPGTAPQPQRPAVLSGLQRPLTRQVMEELGLDPVLTEVQAPCQPAFQLLLPDARFDVVNDDEALLEQLNRELRLPRAEVESLLFRLARASRTVERLLRSPWHERWPQPESGGLASVALPAGATGSIIAGPSLASSPLAPAALGPLAVTRLWSSWRQGTAILTVDGRAALERYLHRQILDAGGEVLADADPVALMVSPGNMPRGVMLEGHGPVLGLDFVLGLDPRLLRRQQMLGPQPWLPQTVVSASRHSFDLRVRGGWLPDSLGQLAVLVDPSHSLVLMPLRQPDSEEDRLCVQATLAPGLSAREAAEAIISAVRGVVPLFDNAFLGTVPARHDAPRPVVTLGSGAREPLAGVPGLPLNPVANTVLTHPLVLGALGSEGAFANAWAAAERLSD